MKVNINGTWYDFDTYEELEKKIKEIKEEKKNTNEIKWLGI